MRQSVGIGKNLWASLWIHPRSARSRLSFSRQFNVHLVGYFANLFRIRVNLASFPLLPRTRSRAGLLAASMSLVSTWVGQAQAMELPSGVEAELQEVLLETIGSENWLRFRFTAPEIERSRPEAPGFAVLEQDFPHLCATLAVPYIEEHEIDADRIVISIADRHVEFGVTDPEATQYFEQFRLEGGNCVWEAF